MEKEKGEKTKEEKEESEAGEGFGGGRQRWHNKGFLFPQFHHVFSSPRSPPLIRVLATMFDAPASPCGGGRGNHESDEHSPRSYFRKYGYDTFNMIHSVGEYVNALWLMVCNSKEMAIRLVKVKRL
ncbi:hypothetical protein JHK87_034824 [Glycine soja]|nr:hypothetical protein JHK87_034824 [Glycine soja]